MKKLYGGNYTVGNGVNAHSDPMYFRSHKLLGITRILSIIGYTEGRFIYRTNSIKEIKVCGQQSEVSSQV